jgi:hypothetical protein
MIAALLMLLSLAASAAEKKNCPNGNSVFAEPPGKYAGKSELRFRFDDAGMPINIGTMTLTAGGKVERYNIPLTTGGAARMTVANVENGDVWSEVAFFDRSLNESADEDAAMIYMPELQDKREKLLPGSEFIGRVWHFKKCEPAK